MKLRPLGNRVIIKVKENKERIVGGIVLPETAKEKPNQGEVVAVGPGEYRDGQLIPMDVKVGDTVIYKKFAGSEVDLDEEGTYVIMDQNEILAVQE